MSETQETQEVTAAMIGFNMFGQCIDFSTDEGDKDQTFVTFKMKILDIVYTCTIPKLEFLDQRNVEAAWSGLMKEFFIRHAMGNNKLFKHGSRELTEEETIAKEKMKKAKDAGLVLL